MNEVVLKVLRTPAADLELNFSQKCVLVFLLTFLPINRAGGPIVWPSTELVSAVTGLHRHTVLLAVHRLADMEIIQERDGGYQLNVLKIPGLDWPACVGIT